MRAQSNKRNSAGFTLMEVLVSSVLIATVFVAVVSLMSQSLRNLERMKPHELAMAHAREKMTEELLHEQLAPEHTSGSWSDGYRWQMDVAKQPAVAMRYANYALFSVRVEVAWGESQPQHTYTLATTQWAQLPPQVVQP